MIQIKLDTESLFGNQDIFEVLESVFGQYSANRYKNMKVEPSFVIEYPDEDEIDVGDGAAGTVRFVVSFGASRYAELIRFKMQEYPACCAAVMLYDFISSIKATTQLNREYLYEKLTLAINCMWENRTWWTNRRIFLMAVTHTNEEEERRFAPEQGNEEIPRNYEPSKDFQYGEVVKFLRESSVRFTSNPVWNRNSDNICHHIEVILNQS